MAVGARAAAVGAEQATCLLPAAAMEPQDALPDGRASPAVGQEGGCTEADRRAEHAQPVRGDAAEGRDVTEGGIS